ncbi:hypothetical protein EVAR_19840_1 [Eumeta japonica]|uniref:Uncharacterized protein n=1 Tax=Eumeta variegata TaxID=151549 RepID=A0A4C1US39_EUMVA|nr:hypothetical protein EVAR_19840_1 [Eumeta japonica]
MLAASMRSSASSVRGLPDKQKPTQHAPKGICVENCKSYRMVSLNATLALSDLLPLVLRAEESAALYKHKKNFSNDYFPPGRELETGVTYLEQHYKEFRLKYNPGCECDVEIEETVWHLLLECPRVLAARLQLEYKIERTLSQQAIPTIMADIKNRPIGSLKRQHFHDKHKAQSLLRTVPGGNREKQVQSSQDQKQNDPAVLRGKLVEPADETQERINEIREDRIHLEKSRNTSWESHQNLGENLEDDGDIQTTGKKDVDRNEARRIGEQRDRSNALGLECGLVRRVGALSFSMQRSNLSIMLTKILPVESTLPKPQRVIPFEEGSILNLHGHYLETITPDRYTNRRTGGMIYDEHSGTTASITSVISKEDEIRHSKVTAQCRSCLRHGGNGGGVFLLEENKAFEFADRVTKECVRSCGILEEKDDAIPSDPLQAAIDNVLDIGR